MRILFLILWLVSFVNAQRVDTIDGLIAHAIKVHPSLRAIEHRLSAMDTRIKRSQNFKNPKVSLAISDIQFADPLSRDLEPMQYQAINVQQTLPWFGKLEANKQYRQAEKKVVFHSYESAKIALAKEIRLAVYTMQELKERLAILHSYQALTQQNIALYDAYASTEGKSHSASMSASLLLSKLKIKEQHYLSLLKSQKAKLHYLTQTKVSHIKNKNSVKKPLSLQSYLHKLKHNPNYKKIQAQKKVAMQDKVRKDLAHTPDPYVKVGYFNRQKYADYASISAGISLPLYETEAQNSEIARRAVLEASSQILDYRLTLSNAIETSYYALEEAYRVYHVIQDESLPQLAHMFELSQSSIQNGADLFAYTRLLEDKLELEEELILFKANYLRNDATLKSLIGEI